MIASLKCSLRATPTSFASRRSRVGVDLPADDEALDAGVLGPADVLLGGRSCRRSNSGRAAGSRSWPAATSWVEPDVVVGEHRLRTARDGARGRRSGAEPDDGEWWRPGRRRASAASSAHRLRPTATGERAPDRAPAGLPRASLGRLAATRPNEHGSEEEEAADEVGIADHLQRRRPDCATARPGSRTRSRPVDHLDLVLAPAAAIAASPRRRRAERRRVSVRVREPSEWPIGTPTKRSSRTERGRRRARAGCGARRVRAM